MATGSMLLLVAGIVVAIIAAYFYGKYRQANRDELRLKRLRNMRERAEGHYQEKYARPRRGLVEIKARRLAQKTRSAMQMS